MPSATGGTPTSPTPTKRRNPWTWPLIALVALLAVVLVGTIIALLAAPGGPTPTHSPTNTTAPPSQTPSATPTLVTLKESDILGLTKAAAQAKLESLNLVMNATNGDPASTAAQVGTAETVQPVGNLPPGSTVNVGFYTALPTPSAPTVPTTTATAPYSANQQVDISWSDYTGCPSDLDLSGYNVTLNGAGASTSESNPITTSEAGETITLGNSGTTTVTYTAVCGTGASSIQSAPSPALSFPITP